jgi:7-cyano-7-deazaguanine reductase
MSEIENLKCLGSSTKYLYDKPDPGLLEKFPSSAIGSENPSRAEQSILIVCPEFTSLCPKTGQPDFATIRIEYTPSEWCVESKSLKLYLGSFRMHGEFHEACVNRICNDLVKLLLPDFLEVRGEFTPRGGIPFWPTSVYYADI